MNSLKQLKEENENLKRELADACMEVVDLTIAYRKLNDKYKNMQLGFAKILLKHGYADSEEEAKSQANQKALEIRKPEQLELPLKKETDLY